MVGRVDDVRTEPLDERVHRDLQFASTRDRPKQRELGVGIGGNQVVGDQADQAERAGMSELIEKIDADGVEPVGNVGRVVQPALPGDDGEVGSLELHPDAGSEVALLP